MFRQNLGVFDNMSTSHYVRPRLRTSPVFSLFRDLFSVEWDVKP